MNTVDTTQVCKKCKQDKPLTEYHRRGISHQRICKMCRKAHVPSGKNRIIILNTSELQQQMVERIKPIENKILAIAMSLSKDLLEADDIYMAMVEEVLFKCQPQDSDARILTRAKWAGYAIIRRYRAYSILVEDEEGMAIKLKDEDDEDELIVNPYASAEDDFIRRESMAEILEKIATLPKEHQVIVSFLAVGYNQREISLKLKKSDQAISAAIKNIANQLSSLGLSPAFI